MKAKELLILGQNALKHAGIEEWDYDSRMLLSWTCHITRTDLILEPEKEVETESAIKFQDMIKKRAAHEPLQYLMGECEFMGLTFYVNPSVLIPRQDTEVLLEWMLDAEKIHWKEKMDVLDVCTGSGCIAISFTKLWEEKGYQPLNTKAVDISERALETAMKNNHYHEAGVEFIQGDMLSKVQGAYDIIVSNPPYIPTKVVDELMEEVVGHEPRIALDGMEDGLHFYRILAEDGRKNLKKGGRLYLEIGHDQGESVSELLKEHGFTDIEVKKDLAGLDRCVRAVFKGRK